MVFLLNIRSYIAAFCDSIKCYELMCFEHDEHAVQTQVTFSHATPLHSHNHRNALCLARPTILVPSLWTVSKQLKLCTRLKSKRTQANN